MASFICTKCAQRGDYCLECYYYRSHFTCAQHAQRIGFCDCSKCIVDINWKYSRHVYTRRAIFSLMTDKLFGTLLLGIQRLEDEGALQIADAFMLEEMLECWQYKDEVNLYPLHFSSA